MYKRKSDGMWCQKIREGDSYRVVYGRTQRELKEKCANLKPKSIDFCAVANEWWEGHQEILSPSGKRTYYAAFKRAVKALGDKDIDTLRPVDFSRWLNNTIQDLELSEATARTHLGIVTMVCRYAVNKGYIDFDPTSSLRLPSGLRKKRRELPESEDIIKIKESKDCPMKLFAIMALYTGMRRGELLALKKSDIDPTERTIRIERAMQMDSSRRKIKEPKTEAGKRIVGIPDSLLPYLKDLPDGFIFNRDGLPLTENQFLWEWRLYSRETGIKTTPHQLRHAYTTALIEMGIPPEEAMRLVGHARIATTLETYTHLRKERANNLARKTLSLEYVP